MSLAITYDHSMPRSGTHRQALRRECQTEFVFCYFTGIATGNHEVERIAELRILLRPGQLGEPMTSGVIPARSTQSK